MDSRPWVRDDNFGLVKGRNSQIDRANGLLFDGFECAIPQSDAMKSAAVKLDVMREIDVHDSAIVERMSGRRGHQP